MEISQITDYLYISPRQMVKDIEQISQLDLGLIIDMVIHRKPPREIQNSRIDILSLPAIDFVLIPIPIKLLNHGVEASLTVINQGRSVLVYCHAGRHRSVAMACCILVAKGYSADKAIELVKAKRQKADPDAWHIKRQIKHYEKWRSKI